jgi:hypothetical protein
MAVRRRAPNEEIAAAKPGTWCARWTILKEEAEKSVAHSESRAREDSNRA